VTELAVCIPVYDDWSAVGRLLEGLDGVAAGLSDELHVLLVDDGSNEPAPERLAFTPRALRSVRVLPLRRNLGHQRAIALGLTHLYAERQARAVLVMDADGEDAPGDVPKLLKELAAHGEKKAVFAARARRSEGLRFWFGYQAYKAIHRVLTGRKVEVGNFSVLPWALLERLVGVSEIWNHYAAAVYKARFPLVQVAVPRARRLDGRSKMNFVGLVTHGLSAISVYGDTVGVRLICCAAGLIALAVTGLAVALGLELTSPDALPAWVASWTGLVGVLLVGLLGVLTLAVLFLLQSRERYSFLPLRDYRHYLLPERTLFG
jgi:glycosyltransferase involved in cell wall biosynthesis